MEVLKTTIERKKRKKETLTKLDLEKPNEYTNWDFLDHVMARKGFGSKWRTWTSGCLVSSHFSILINGMPGGFFSTSRGLRQRDPLSPFLFTLVADAFNQLLSRGKEQNLFKGIQVGKEKISISHLQYADDTLLFLDGHKNQLKNLISLIHCFELVFGTRINWQKSCFVGIIPPYKIFLIPPKP